MLKKYFNNIFKYSDLVWQFSVREIQARHKGSKLGSIWSIITPVLMLGLYFMVFGLIFQGKFGVLQNENFFDFAVALFLGLTQFNIIADTISSSPTLISNQPNFVKKVIFPLEILSISKIVSSFYFAFISITICIILMAFTKTGLTIHILELPVLLVPLALISLGLSLGLSALGLFIKDLNHATNFIVTALMYSSAIVYSPSRLPIRLKYILEYNPLLIIIDQSRRILCWNQSIQIRKVITIYIIASFILSIGYYLFKKLRPYFSEVI